MLSLLLADVAIAKLGAAIGAGLVAIGTGMGIGRIGGQAMDAMARHQKNWRPSFIYDYCCSFDRRCCVFGCNRFNPCNCNVIMDTTC